MTKPIILIGPIVATNRGWGWTWQDGQGRLHTSPEHDKTGDATMYRHALMDSQARCGHVITAATTEGFTVLHLHLKESAHRAKAQAA
jgi:hypothetical protein